MAKSVEEVRKKFAEENMYCEIYEHENGCISIEIEWGDWKHDHIYLVNVMKENGYIRISNVITEENGTDAYTAEYLFTKDTSKV